MPLQSLATYTMRVREKRTTQALRLAAFNGRDHFADVMGDFLDRLQRHDLDEEVKRLQHVSRLERDDDILQGTLMAGEYGYTADLVNIESLETSYQRVPEDAELLPFFFVIDARGDRHRCVLILQRIGHYGIYTAFSRSFRDYFGNRFPGHTLDINPHVPADVLRHLLNGELKEITLTDYVIPADITDRVSLRGNLEETAVVRVRISARRGKVLLPPRWLRDLRNRQGGLLELSQDVSEMADRVQLTTELNGRKRTVDLNNPESIAPYIELPREVELGDDGHVVYESIQRYAADLLEDLRAEFGERE